MVRAGRPAQPAASHFLGAHVRVTRVDGSSVLLRNAFVANDSVAGYGIDTAVPGERVAIPVREVRTVKSRRGDGAKTIGGTVAIGVVVAGAALYVMLARAFN